MKCAIGVQDPCEGDVKRRRIHTRMGVEQVPLCTKHWDAWGSRIPFRTLTAPEREKWARWAADRARRQELARVSGQRVRLTP